MLGITVIAVLVSATLAFNQAIGAPEATVGSDRKVIVSKTNGINHVVILNAQNLDIIEDIITSDVVSLTANGNILQIVTQVDDHVDVELRDLRTGELIRSTTVADGVFQQVIEADIVSRLG